MSAPLSTQRPKILFLLSHLGTHGGTHRVAIALANRMAQDYEVHLAAIYGAGEQPCYPLDERVHTAVFLPEELRLRSMALALRKPLTAYIHEHTIKIVFLIGNYQVFCALPTMLGCRGSRAPRFVFCDHGALANQWDDRAIRLMHRLGSRFASRTVVLTEQSRADYLRLLHRDPRRIVTIPNWVDQRLISAALPYDPRSRMLLWAGRLDGEKGTDALLDIATRVLPEYPSWTWEVYGDGELAQDFCEGIAARGLQGHLIARGSTDDLYACYPRAAVVTLTSRREGLPLTLLEGKACGIPLIAFDVLTGPREIIRDGIDGLLIEPGDTARFAEELARLMSNDALRERMSAAARDDVKRFSQEAIYAKWQALIAEMTGDTAENYASSAAVNPSPGIETTSNTEKHPLASTPPANKSHSPHRQAQR